MTKSLRGLQQAIDFLGSLRSRHEAGLLAEATPPADFDYESLVRLAVEFGYTVDAEDIAEAFRIRMAGRRAAQTRAANSKADGI